MLSNDDLDRCEKFSREFCIWLNNFIPGKPPVIEYLNDQGWFLVTTQVAF
jgi:hypothetical protein